eukprot:CAMPEP_0115069358 /NCGR_PEP_ID=MMETSP0227-20121206/12513_1 /TAXON_ID=89957 /ORGANISM="Polarella glacialis, Strain CCMP 1383" /LENGTH=37 /DNA_ID= /DNA_START= /DNA_END= /DNA_ORIENTATION=
MDEALAVHVLETCDHLLGNDQDCARTEILVAFDEDAF